MNVDGIGGGGGGGGCGDRVSGGHGGIDDSNALVWSRTLGLGASPVKPFFV